MQKASTKTQIVRDLHQIAKFGLGRHDALAELTLLDFEIVVEAAAGSEDIAERLLALGRVLKAIGVEHIRTLPHPDDAPHLRAWAAEMLLYPEGRHAKKSLGERRTFIRQHIALRRHFDRRTYEARLLEDIADELFARERAVQAGLRDPIALDVNLALRLDSASDCYVRELRVTPGDVVEIAAVIRLSDPPGAGHQAQELSLALELSPSDQIVTCELEARALNARHAPGYTPFDSGNLTSGNAAPIAVDNLRAFYFQAAHTGETPDFGWDEGRRMPDNWLRLWHAPEGVWSVHIRATIDHTLSAEYDDALKFSFLVDIIDGS